MSKPMYPRPPTVLISPHAFARWMLRANRKPRSVRRLQAMVGKLLDNQLAAGVAVDDTDAVKIQLQNVTAVLRLGDDVWVCTTFLELGRLGNEN